MVQCLACNAQFVNNLSGLLTTHLREAHQLTLEDYVVKFELGGVEPRCECGLCDERPAFMRGKFVTHAPFHRQFNVRRDLYLKRYGEPRCARCNVVVGFSRGEPKRWCSQRCAIVGKGFGNPIVQAKIVENVIARYGVRNTFQRPDVIAKIAVKNRARTHAPLTAEHKLKISNASKRMWKENYDRVYAAVCRGIRDFEKRHLKRLLNPTKHLLCGWNRLTGLHCRLRIELRLDELGFISEQRVGTFIADELHAEKRIIVEFNGDYAHANPKTYASDDVIRLPGQRYTAAEKWASDARKRTMLEQAGYKILTIWESDDIDEARKELALLLESV